MVKLRGGFTLIELLVVIAIIAILSVVVILTLNPAELLRQSRDSNRISDLSVTKSGIAYYLASVASPVVGTSSICYQNAASTSLVANTMGTTSVACAVFFPSVTGVTATSSNYTTSTAVDGTGWIPINFNSITAGGSPLGSLPHDPSNNDGVHLYLYTPSSTGLVYKMDAHMESSKYNKGGTNDIASTDGGKDTGSYEQGTSLSL